MVMVCIDYLLLIIICLRYVSIFYIYRGIKLVAKFAVLESAAVPRLPCGSAACGERQCRTFNFN